MRWNAVISAIWTTHNFLRVCVGQKIVIGYWKKQRLRRSNRQIKVVVATCEAVQCPLYDKNVLTRPKERKENEDVARWPWISWRLPRIGWRHNGHVVRAGAHITQVSKCPHGRKTTPTSSAMQILHSTFFNRRSDSSDAGNFKDLSAMLASDSGTMVLVEGRFALVLGAASSLLSLTSTDETAERRSCVTWLSSCRFTSVLSNPSSSICPSSTAETKASVLLKGRPVRLIFRCITALTLPAFNPIESASRAAWVFIASSTVIVGAGGSDWFPDCWLPLSDDRCKTLLM